MLDVVPLEAARQLLGLTYQEVWDAYFALGGNCPPAEIERYLQGGPELAAHDHDTLVQALNETFLEREMAHPLDYSSE